MITTTTTDRYTKQIDCPAHPGQHKATLYCHGHKFAGIWECSVTFEADDHNHTEFVTETATNTSWSYELEDTVDTEYQIEVCAECGVEKPGEY